ncbi:MAG: NB-ARC domain-containing protein [Cyanobacteria bacterium J06639_1]
MSQTGMPLLSELDEGSVAIALVDRALAPQGLNDIQSLVFEQVWAGRTYAHIADGAGYDPNYLKDVGYRLWKHLSRVWGEKVTKSNVRAVVRRQLVEGAAMADGLAPSSRSCHRLAPVSQPTEAGLEESAVSWGEAVDTSSFLGRDRELALLQTWVVRDRCRLVALLGMGGMGKTTLSVKLAETVATEFDCVVWRSLRHGPQLSELLADIVPLMSRSELPVAPSMADLTRVLQTRRCLLVLDNVETVLDTGAGTLCDRAGAYAAGYEDYGDLFQKVGSVRYRSCVVLTSREKPKALAAIEGETCPVRSLQLTGLSPNEGRNLCAAKGEFFGSDADWQHFVSYYAGNPLALKMAAAGIQEVFDSNLAEFLRYLSDRGLAFDDICSLLSCQFDRLSDIEREMMYWLAVKREPVSAQQLLADAIAPDARRLVPQALRSLQQRSLCGSVKSHHADATQAGLTLQPVVMEFVTERFLVQLEREIVSGQIDYLDRLPLLEGRGRHHARTLQRRKIVKPLLQRLLARHTRPELVEQFSVILTGLRADYPQSVGFAAGNVINILVHLQSHLNDWDFSYLTVRHADLRHVSLNRTRFTGTRFIQSAFTETFGIPLAIAFSAAGDTFVTGGADNAIALWHADGNKIATGEGHRGWVWSVAFRPDGQAIASGSDDGDVRLWDEGGRHSIVLTGHECPVWAVAFSPDGALLASGSEDGTIRLWDGITGEAISTLSTGEWVRSIAFHPTLPILASSGDSGQISFWNLETYQRDFQIEAHAAIVWAIAFSPDGRWLASGSSDRLVKVWDWETGECARVLEGHANQVRALAFQPTAAASSVLASGSEDRSIRIWHVDTGDCLHLLNGHSNWVRSLTFSPDGQTLVSGGGDRALKFWRVERGQCDRAIQGYANRMWSVAAHPDGQTIASAHDDRAIRLWDSRSGRCLRTLRGHESTVYSVAFDPEGRFIASGGADKTVKIWDVASSRCWRTFCGHDSRVWSVAVSPNGRWIASGSDDRTVRLWDVERDGGEQVLRGHQSWVCAVAFSPDGRYLASGSYDRSVKLWDLQTGECLQTLSASTHWIWTVAFSPDGCSLAAAGGDGIIQLWSVAALVSGASVDPTRCVAAHDSRIWSIAFSPEGDKLASCSSDLTVKLWDLATGTCDRVLSGHENLIWSVAFDRLSPVLYSCGQDETLRSWDLDTGAGLHCLEAARPYEDMAIAGAAGLTDAQIRTLQALGASDRVAEPFSLFQMPNLTELSMCSS